MAVGALAKQILEQFNIKCHSRIIQIGQGKTEEEFKNEIDKAKEAGDTLGGKFEVIMKICRLVLVLLCIGIECLMVKLLRL